MVSITKMVTTCMGCLLYILRGSFLTWNGIPQAQWANLTCSAQTTFKQASHCHEATASQS